MKVLICMLGLVVSLFGSSQELPKFLSKTEKKFVKNVINIYGTEPQSIVKDENNDIIVTFKNIKLVLRPNGYIGEMWIYEESDWVSLGTEEDAY